MFVFVKIGLLQPKLTLALLAVCVGTDGFQPLNLLPLPSKCWDCMHTLPHWVKNFNFEEVQFVIFLSWFMLFVLCVKKVLSENSSSVFSGMHFETFMCGTYELFCYLCKRRDFLTVDGKLSQRCLRLPFLHQMAFPPLSEIKPRPSNGSAGKGDGCQTCQPKLSLLGPLAVGESQVSAAVLWPDVPQCHMHTHKKFTVTV